MINEFRLSKAISHALRHAPQKYGLTLDEAGWVAVDDLLAGLRSKRREWEAVSAETLTTLMANAHKQRFEMHGGKIRALYGHSTQTKIVKERVAPPVHLYHGTSPTVLDKILQEGLKPMRRQYVHLSADIETAHIVGKRHHPNPVILTVHARSAHENGTPFYTEPNGIWLAEAILPTFLEITAVS